MSSNFSRHVLCFVMLVTLTENYEASCQSNTSSMRPSLVAIQVENLEKSIDWYTNYLEFSVLSKKEFKEHGLKVALLESNDFKFELVENSKSLKKNELLKNNAATEITGFAKITFTTANVSLLFQRFKEKGASFPVSLKESNLNPKEHFFIVLDNENNWLQFYGPK